MAAARAEAEEAVAPILGHGHSAKEVEFLQGTNLSARQSEATGWNSIPDLLMSLPTRPPLQRMGKEKRLALQQEVLSLLRKGTIEPVRERQADF